MKIKCQSFRVSDILKKGIEYVVECLNIGIKYEDLSNLYFLVNDLFIDKLLIDKGADWSLVFSENEPIGTNFIVYKFRLYNEKRDGKYIGIRVITYNKEILHIIATVDKSLTSYVDWGKIENLPIKYNYNLSMSSINRSSGSNKPPGQKYIPYFIIYRILGQPHIPENWNLIIDGLVRKRIRYSYNELFRFKLRRLRRDFHCVTGWSIRDVLWEGIPLIDLVNPDNISEEAKWAYTYSLDGYTTVIPIDDFLSEDSLLVIKINGKPLSPEQGFPARIFIPHLYEWKGAKWIHRIVFIKDYINGYWESLGYHVRGNVWLEERFK